MLLVRHAMLRALLLLGLPGCLTYQPGAFAYGVSGFAGSHTTVGCLDLAVQRREDHDKSAVLSYRFGNRCDHPAVVDLGALRVVGRDPAGMEYALRPFDPKAQIRALPLDARRIGGEAIAYVVDADLGVELVQVCVDAGGLVAGHAERWLCFAQDIPEDVGPPPDEELVLVHEEAA